MRRNSCLEVVLSELEDYGIKGTVEHLSKHIEVSWTVPGGQQRRHIVSSTPSDHRSMLNHRADVRRQLRQDNIQPVPRNIISFEKALSLPKPVDPPPVRLQGLEDDVGVLLDWVVEGREQLATALAEVAVLRTQLQNMRVTISFDAAVPAAITAQVPVPAPAVEAPARPKRQSGEKTQRELLLEHMTPGVWCNFSKLVETSGVKRTSAGAQLCKLRGEGFVESGQRGWWRRKPLEQMFQAQA